MAAFAITFRIGTDRTNYQEVWQSVVDIIKSEATAGSTWEETSSFFLLRSQKSATDICNNIYVKSKFDANKDVMVVINLSRDDYAEKGAKYPATLGSLVRPR